MFVRIHEQQMTADLYEAIGIGLISYAKPVDQAKLSVVVVTILLQLQENVTHKHYSKECRIVIVSIYPGAYVKWICQYWQMDKMVYVTGLTRAIIYFSM